MYRRRHVSLATGALLLALLGLWMFLKPWHEQAALRRARERNVRVFNLAELNRGDSGGPDDRVMFRRNSDDGDLFLFRRRGRSGVVECNLRTGEVSLSAPDAWKSATGEIADERQSYMYVSGLWSYDGDSGRLLRQGVPVQTRAKNHLSWALSPGGEKIAIVTADGRFKPGSRELIFVFPGTHNRASGRHYVEVLAFPSGDRLMEPVAIPFHSSWRGVVEVYWSADERFLWCKTDYYFYCAVPTLLEPTFPLSPTPGEREYDIFSIRECSEPADSTISTRYEDAIRRVLLVHCDTARMTYAFDTRARTFAPVENARWQTAIGEIQNQINSSFARSEDSPGDRVVIGGQAAYVGPMRTWAIVWSMEDRHAGSFYQQAFRLPQREPVGTPLKIPVRAVVGRLPDVPRPFAWAPDDRFVFYLNQDRMALLIVPVDTEQ